MRRPPCTHKESAEMFWYSLFFALAIALFLALLFRPVLDLRREPGKGIALIPFFVIVFMVTWAGGLWLQPFGPTTWGLPWLVFVTVGLVTAILIAATIPPVPHRQDGRLAEGPEDDPRVAEVPVFNWFFWALITVTVVAVVLANL
ncbi:MAG: hypothetical protein R3F30_04690 [Planctomycetota bacterium]